MRPNNNCIVVIREVNENDIGDNIKKKKKLLAIPDYLSSTLEAYLLVVVCFFFTFRNGRPLYFWNGKVFRKYFWIDCVFVCCWYNWRSFNWIYVWKWFVRNNIMYALKTYKFLCYLSSLDLKADPTKCTPNQYDVDQFKLKDIAHYSNGISEFTVFGQSNDWLFMGLANIFNIVIYDICKQRYTELSKSLHLTVLIQC